MARSEFVLHDSTGSHCVQDHPVFHHSPPTHLHKGLLRYLLLSFPRVQFLWSSSQSTRVCQPGGATLPNVAEWIDGFVARHHVIIDGSDAPAVAVIHLYNGMSHTDNVCAWFVTSKMYRLVYSLVLKREIDGDCDQGCCPLPPDLEG